MRHASATRGSASFAEPKVKPSAWAFAHRGQGCHSQVTYAGRNLCSGLSAVRPVNWSRYRVIAGERNSVILRISPVAVYCSSASASSRVRRIPSSVSCKIRTDVYRFRSGVCTLRCIRRNGTLGDSFTPFRGPTKYLHRVCQFIPVRWNIENHGAEAERDVARELACDAGIAANKVGAERFIILHGPKPVGCALRYRMMTKCR